MVHNASTLKPLCRVLTVSMYSGGKKPANETILDTAVHKKASETVQRLCLLRLALRR